MKHLKHFCYLLILFVSFSLAAQQGINYKALIKDNNGNVVANDLIVVQFTILEGVGMANVYQETHTPNTDANGIVIVNIGEGSVNSGSFSTIDWGSDDHFLNVQINIGGGLTDMGTTGFKYVPLAHHSNTSTVSDSSSESGKVLMFESGASNADKMVIQHSNTFDDWGLQYADVGDDFNFVAGGITNLSIDLSTGNMTSQGTIELPTTTTSPQQNRIYGNSVPIAYGSIDSLGGISTGYGISSVNNSSTGVYEITLNLNSNPDNTVVMITPFTIGFGIPEICGYETTGANTFTVRIQDAGGTARDSAFSFVVYGN